MPVMDGLEAARRIRSRHPAAEARILAVTARVFEVNRQEALAAGIDDLVRKPFLESELCEKVAAALGLEVICAADGEREPTKGGPDTSGPGWRAELEALSPDVVARLRDAALSARYEELLNLCAQAETGTPALAGWIRRRAQSFDYPAIIRMLSGEWNDDRF